MMGLAFVPLYIKYLGIEAYGLIGFFALMQTWLSLLDMGITPTLNREMALYSGGVQATDSIRDLLRSFELICLASISLFLLGIFLTSGWLAGSWLKSKTIPIKELKDAIVIMAIVGALRFFENIYRGALMGLQRQVLLNLIMSVFATFRGIGALAVLVYYSPTIKAFFIWQGMVSIASLCVLIFATYIGLPNRINPEKFSLDRLEGAWRFTGGMAVIGFLTLILGQIDKLLLSKMIGLDEFGEYMLATSVAGIILILVGPATQAYYPKLCNAYADKNQEIFSHTYQSVAQIVAVLVGSVAIVLIFYSESLLEWWTGNRHLSIKVAPIVSLLALGNLLNAVMAVPYQAQLAHGWTSLSIKMNVAAIFLWIPILILFVPRFGGKAAAIGWLLLTIFYMVVGSTLMFKKILNREQYTWIRYSVVQPLVIGSILILVLKLVFPIPDSVLGKAIYFLTIYLSLVVTMAIITPNIRIFLKTATLR